jgi:hypothetical protein
MANLTQLLCQTPMMNPVRLSINDNHLKSFDNLSTLSHFLPLVEQEAVLGKCAKRDIKKGGNPLFSEISFHFHRLRKCAKR